MEESESSLLFLSLRLRNFNRKLEARLILIKSYVGPSQINVGMRMLFILIGKRY